MKRGLAVAVVVAVIALLVAWWSRRDDEGDAGDAPATTRARAGDHRPGSGPDLAAIDLSRGARRIRGRVIAGDQPVAATVWIARDHRWDASTTSAADGRFELRDLPAEKLLVSGRPSTRAAARTSTCAPAISWASCSGSAPANAL